VLNLKPNSEYDGSGNPNWVEYDIGSATLGIGCAPGMWSLDQRRFGGSRDEDFEQALETVKPKTFPSLWDLRVSILPYGGHCRPRRKPHHFAQAQEEVSSSEPSFELRRFRSHPSVHRPGRPPPRAVVDYGRRPDAQNGRHIAISRPQPIVT